MSNVSCKQCAHQKTGITAKGELTDFATKKEKLIKNEKINKI